LDTQLNKKQLQEILRQMGIDYSPTASKEDLIKRLQLENQNQWMRSAGDGGAFGGNRILRRKSGSIEPVSGDPQRRERVDTSPHRDAPAARMPPKRVPYEEPARETESAWLRPDPELPGVTRPPVFQSAQEIESYALRRANGVCDLCETRIKESEARLTACFFMDPPEGKHGTIKEVAALCSTCFDRVQSQHLTKDIKILKRKARRKRISEVKIFKR
jgi:hypothetical protein